MNERNSLDSIKTILVDSFEEQSDCQLGEMTFSYHGYWYGSYGRTIIFTQNAVVDRLSLDEHIYLAEVDDVNLETIKVLKRNLKDDVYHRLVKPSNEHQTTTFNIVLVTNQPISLELAKAIRSFKCVKYYLLSLHGWSEANLVVASLSDQKVYASKKAKDLSDAIKKILWEA